MMLCLTVILMDVMMDVSINDDVIGDKNHQITGISADNESFDPKKATAEILKNDQRTGKSLAQCWSLAERDKAGYFVKDGILYRH